MTHSVPQPATIEIVHLTVRIGEKLHAIPISAIEEVLPALPIEPIAQLPEWIRGVLFIRGHLIPILVGTERLGLPASSSTQEPQLVCLRVGGQLIGLEVDEAIDLISLPQDDRLTMAQFGGSRRCLRAIVDYQGEIFRILDPEQLLLQHESDELNSLAHLT